MEDSVSNGVKLMDINGQTDSFIDVTDEFFNSTKSIEVGDVVKSEFFALFEGTRALEMMNKVLDTGLIPLSKEELTFEVKDAQDLKTVVNISTNLFASLMTWLNTSSLPVTVLSCRYVEESLKNFDGLNLESCNFGINKDEYEDGVEFLLVHKVLLSIVRGLLIFIKNVLLLGQAGVLYEEEDITTTTMGFDFLTEIPNYLVEKDIQESIKWVEENIKDPAGEQLISFLKIAKCFSKICNLLEFKIDVYNETSPKVPIFLTDALRELNKIKNDVEILEILPALPIGCFSEGIQKRCDNFLPPRPKQMDTIGSSVEAAINMVEDLMNMLKIIQCRNVIELVQFLDAFMNKRSPPSQVISRAMLQLFLVRDDRSVMGSNGKKFISLLVDDMSSLTCYDSKIFSQFHQGGIPELNQELMELLNNIESAYYSYVLTISQNPCRQRQHFNRSILIWDALQVQSEAFEITVQEKYNVKDFFKIGENVEEIPIMPISSWIYYQKLRSMLEVVLRGVELELYKPWELHSIYWYIEYLTSILTDHFERIILTLEYKKSVILNMPKKVKKLKAGEKKQMMKESYKRKLEIDLPQLESNISSIKLKLSDVSILKCLSELYKQFFTVLYDLNLLKLPKLNKVAEKLSYGLKMKSFHSVGVPEYPDYEKWCSIRDHLTGHVAGKVAKITLLEKIKDNCDVIKTALVELRKKLASDAASSFVNDEKKLVYDQLIKSCVGLAISTTIVLRGLGGGQEMVIEREGGYHRYFPFCKINQRADKGSEP